MQSNDIKDLADRFEKSKANAENWTREEWYAFIFVVTVLCFVIQIIMRNI